MVSKEEATTLDSNFGVGGVDSHVDSKGWGGPLIILGYCVFFLTLKFVTGVVSPIHILYLSAIFILYFLCQWTRNWVAICIPMIVYGTMFDMFGLIPFSALLPIHVKDLYLLDLNSFGVLAGGQKILLNEFIYRVLAHPVSDIISAVFYFLHIPVMILLILYFWNRYSISFAQSFTMAFLLINVLAFSTYYFYPSAAPWYIHKFGFLNPVGPIPGDPAGLVGLEKILKITIFSDNYAISPVVFGAVPSMHVGYATLGWIYSFYTRRGVTVLMTLYLLGMIFSALYLQHHYFIDVVLGIFYGIISWLVVSVIFKNFFNRINKGIFNIFSEGALGTFLS